MFGVTRNRMPLNEIMQIVNNINDPQALFDKMYETNPDFKKFIDDTKGMSVEDIAKKYNVTI